MPNPVLIHLKKTLGVLYIVLDQLTTQVVFTLSLSTLKTLGVPHIVLIHLENTRCTLQYIVLMQLETQVVLYFTLSLSTLKTLVLYIVLIQLET